MLAGVLVYHCVHICLMHLSCHDHASLFSLLDGQDEHEFMTLIIIIMFASLCIP